MKKNDLYYYLTNPFYLLILSTILLFLVASNKYLFWDEGLWQYIGRIWFRDNVIPYNGVIENKTPGIFILYYISDLLFGVNLFFVRALGIISILVSSFLLFKISKIFHSHLAGILCMYLFVLANTWHLLDGAYTGMTETFMNVFSIAALYLIIIAKDKNKWHYWVFFAGISIGFAIAFKQIAIITALAVLCFYIIYSSENHNLYKRLLGVVLLSAGACIATLISFVPLFLSGATFQEYIQGAWLILLNAGSSAPSMNFRIYRFMKIWEESKMVFFYPFLGLILFQGKILKKRYFIAIVIWFVLDFIAVNSSGFIYGHQIKQILPSISVIVGILLSNLIEIIKKNYQNLNYQFAAKALIIIFIVSLFPYTTLSINFFRSGIVNNYTDSARVVGNWVKDHTNEKEFIFFMGGYNTCALSYSERVASTKYVVAGFISSDKERDNVYSDLIAKPPVYVLIDTTYDFINIDYVFGDKVMYYIKNNYTFDHRNCTYDIYKRKQ